VAVVTQIYNLNCYFNKNLNNFLTGFSIPKFHLWSQKCVSLKFRGYVSNNCVNKSVLKQILPRNQAVKIVVIITICSECVCGFT
jgi:hypothetical protein